MTRRISEETYNIRKYQSLALVSLEQVRSPPLRVRIEYLHSFQNLSRIHSSTQRALILYQVVRELSASEKIGRAHV